MSRRHRVAALLGCLLWFFAAAAGARSGLEYRLGVAKFTTEDGLPQAGINAIIQARDGYLWVGTFGGLARFDGTAFELYTRARADGRKDAAPASDRILSLLEDDRGRLWVGTADAGLSVRERERFRHLPLCGGGCGINAIAQGPDGRVWVASSDGIAVFDRAAGQPRWIARSRSIGEFMRLTIDGAGQIHVGGTNGLHLVRADALVPIALPGRETGVQLLERDGGGLLVGSEQRLYRFDPVRRAWRALTPEAAMYAARDAGGRWWLSLASRQVVRETEDGAWRIVPELSGLGIAHLFRDAEGNLWAGSRSNGLLRMRPPLFGLLAESALGTDMAGRAVVADGGDGLWLGSACGGLFHWSRRHGARPIPVEPALGSACISSLLLDSRGALWVGTAGGALGRLENGRLELAGLWPSNESVSIWERGPQDFILAVGRTTYGFTFPFPDLSAPQAERFRRIAALQGMRIAGVAPAAKGGIWLAGSQGVVRLSGDRILERWTRPQGFSSRSARALHEDAAGALWVGTYGDGLYRIERGRVFRYGAGNGLSDETVSCILEDARGRLWLGGNAGVALVPAPRKSAHRIESIRFSASDGLIPSEINGGDSVPCLRDSRGALWFALVSGFATVDPARVPGGESARLKSHIEHVAIDGKPLRPSGGTLLLPSYSSNLEIRYTAVNLGKPRDTAFRFRLTGVDRGWVEAGSNRSVLYPRIPWGRFDFQVQARTGGGAWSNVPDAALSIVHPRPWHQHPWIWGLIALLGLLALAVSGRHDEGRPADDLASALRSRTPPPHDGD